MLRFKSLERKLRRLPDVKAQYVAFIREYISLNQPTLISPQIDQKKYYLPHHCEQKLYNATTKLRVVFDG